jgi:hypothetical protein
MENTVLLDGLPCGRLRGFQMRTFISGDKKHISKKVPNPKPRERVFSHEALRRRMSEVISLREQVAQAELAVSDLVTDPAQTPGAANNDP